MASPQPDKFTKISNELLDAVLAFDFGKRQLKVLFYVIRKTYGYSKKADAMSYGQIAKATGMKRRHVIDAVSELKAMQALIVEKSGTVVRGCELNTIGINKDYDRWTTSDQNSTSAETVTSDQKGTGLVTKTALVTSDQNSHPQKKEEKKERKGNGALPCWLDPEMWNDFQEHRIAMKKPMSAVAVKRMFAELDKFRAAGDDPNEVLNQSIVNGWRGVYRVKRDASAPRRVSLAEAMGEN